MSIPEFSSFRNVTPTRYGAYGYLRVSDPSQAERENSLKQQRRLIEAHFEDKLGIPILGWYIDEGKSASKDHENRDDFWRMVQDAKNNPRVGIIATDEESRFFRDKYMTAKVKGELLEYGVRCLTVKRDADPRTITGLWMETIEETMAHAGALANREYTLRGMAGNVHGRDPETGWAFKNGGTPPYGWKAKRIDMGRDSKGRPIARTYWMLDPGPAEVRRKVLMWRMDGETYDAIRDRLNDAGIPAPRGGLWSTSTIVGMLREDMVWTAAGYTVWNKHYRKRKAKGEKFKPVDDWEIEKNAHPAIITEEEAKAIIALNSERRRKFSEGERKDKTSPFLLVGNNLEGLPLFLCAACGRRVMGWNAGPRNRLRYVCSTKIYKGAKHCESGRIDLEWLESHVVKLLSKRFTKTYIRDVIRMANRCIEEEARKARESDSDRHLKDRREQIIEQLDRIRKSVLAGYDPIVWKDEVEKLTREKEHIESELARIQKAGDEKALRLIPEDEIEAITSRITGALASPDIANRREVVVRLVRQITLSPKQNAIFIELYEDPLDPTSPTLFAMYGNSVVPPRGREIITIPLPR